MKPLPLRVQLTVVYSLISLFTLTALSLFFYFLLDYQLERDLYDDLNERAAALHGYLRFDRGHPFLAYDAADTDEAYFIEKATRYYQIFRVSDGVLLLQSPELKAAGLFFTREEVQSFAENSVTADMKLDRLHLLLHNRVIHAADGQSYLLQVGVSQEPKETALGLLFDILLTLVPLGVLFAAATGWYMSRWLLRPVDTIGAAAGEIGISNLHRRLPVRGTGDELDRLAAVFNQVFARLEQAVQQMKEFTSNISHELRTPLTALRGEAEVALTQYRSVEEYRQVLESQLEEFDKLTLLINRMLMLARAESGEIHMARERFSLSELTLNLTEQMQPVAAWKNISLKVRAEQAIHMIGDAHWMERVILNLLDNAVKFTGEGGSITVTVTQNGCWACLKVCDNGIGIPADALPKIFDRFYRVDSSRSREVDGVGLGLSLTDWIVRQHGGRILVESAPDKGSAFQVELPCAD